MHHPSKPQKPMPQNPIKPSPYLLLGPPRHVAGSSHQSRQQVQSHSLLQLRRTPVQCVTRNNLNL